MTLTDFEVIMDISLDEAVACSLDECEAEAEWRIVLSCCKRDFNLCNEPHYQSLSRVINDVRVPKNVVCHYCSTPIIPSQWLYRVHPI